MLASIILINLRIFLTKSTDLIARSVISWHSPYYRLISPITLAKEFVKVIIDTKTGGSAMIPSEKNKQDRRRHWGRNSVYCRLGTKGGLCSRKSAILGSVNTDLNRRVSRHSCSPLRFIPVSFEYSTMFRVEELWAALYAQWSGISNGTPEKFEKHSTTAGTQEIVSAVYTFAAR